MIQIEIVTKVAMKNIEHRRQDQLFTENHKITKQIMMKNREHLHQHDQLFTENHKIIKRITMMNIGQVTITILKI